MNTDAAATAVSITTASTSTPALPTSMRAWRQGRYGGPDTQRLEQVAVPTPGAGEVLIEVSATALNAADIRVMRGTPLLIRPFFGLRRPRIPTRGMDVAGTVVAVGPEVVGLAVGDEVVGEVPGGGLADFVAAPANRLVHRPAELDAVTAAALPLAGGTATQALELGAVATRVDDPQRILVIGASGGVGTYTVQLAALRGAEVWALCGARNERLIAELGATRTFDYRTVDVATLPAASFDAIIDIAGTAPLRTLRRLLLPTGTLVMVAGDGGDVVGPIGRIVRAALLGIARGARLRPLAAVAKADITRDLLALAAEERLVPHIERTWPLAEASAALAHVDAGHSVGKVVVLP